jgi:serine/threonine protein kinase
MVPTLASDQIGQQDMTKENQARRPEGGGARATPPPRPTKRPASAIVPSIMGEQNRPRSGSATGCLLQGGQQQQAPSRQHKLKQRFTVIRKLGKGTYGKVQLAINKETGQEVAIKTIKKTKIDNEQDLERVRREIQIMSSIEHPHIIHIYEVFENKDKIVLIMQYAPGGELYEYVSQSKVLDEQEARRLFRQIATAIYYCHQNKICHRDLKLENILLDEKNNAKLADFGLSNVFDKGRQLKTFCGSPLYASPEIVQGSPYEGPEVDCWSLGVLLYTLVYGAMPFDGSNFKRLVKQISEASYYEPKQRSQASPLIGRLLCADPRRRASILDICTDPWVNGQSSASPLASPGLGPLSVGSNAGGQPQHPSLLKVAQDMANLTPVRLDILLALTPTPDEQPSSIVDQQQRQQQQKQQQHYLQQQNEPNQLDRADHSTPEVRGPAPASPSKDLIQRPSLVTHAGSDLMDVDQQTTNRSSSPSASRVAGDLASIASNEPPLPSAPSVVGTLSRVVSDAEMEMVVGPEAYDAVGRAAAQEARLAPADDKTTTSTTTEQNLDHSMNVDEPIVQDAPAAVVATTDSAVESSKGPAAVADAMTVDDAQSSAAVDKPEEKQSEPPMRADERPEPSAETAEHVKSSEAQQSGAEGRQEQPQAVAEEEDATARSKLDDVEAATTTADGDHHRDAVGQEEPSTVVKAVDEGKPKRLKKRIVVVKKKKKVSKKEQDDKTQEGEELASEASKMTKKATGEAKKDGGGKTTGSGGGSGPGKVRIPETFQSGAGESGTSAQAASPAPKATATRRQSALIADVSQRLLQQQHESGQTSSSAVDMDQLQLASVRVSDTKSEFERRASLAATTLTPPASVSPKGSDRSLAATPTNQLEADETVALEAQVQQEQEQQKPQQSQQQQQQQQTTEVVQANSTDKPRVQQEPTASRREMIEPVNATTIAAEPVQRQTPLEFQQLTVITTPSEPQTPTNVGQLHEFQTVTGNETLARCADRLSVDVCANRDGSRSDSVETIKADWPESGCAERQGAAAADKREFAQSAPRETPKNSSGASSTNNNIRSSIQIDLRDPATGGSESGSASSVQTPMIGSPRAVAGPAPITRSYKKVTFTKDGACVTETGRIYSARNDDGTVRRIERKSKVTHYPSDSTADGARAASTHEEIVYETSMADSGQHWDRQTAGVQRRTRSSTSGVNQRLERLVMPSESLYGGDDLEADWPFQQQQVDGHQASAYTDDEAAGQFYQHDRTDSASSCSSGSTDVFDDIFDTWTGAISMFNQGAHLAGLRNSLMRNRAFVAGSPLPFGGRRTGSLRRRHSGNSRQQAAPQAQQQQQAGGQPQSGGAAFIPNQHRRMETGGGPFDVDVDQHHRGQQQERCESADMAGGRHKSAWGFGGGRPRRHSRRHHRHGGCSSLSGRSSADPSAGYESDVPFELPGGRRSGPSTASTQLSSARGRFGSSNLFPRFDGVFANDRFGFDDGPGDLLADDWPASSLFERMQLEHEMMRRRFAQQRKQMWKGSTPVLNEVPSWNEQTTTVHHEPPPDQVRRFDPSPGQQLAREAPSQAFNQQQRQQQANNPAAQATRVVRQTNSDASLRQSIPLDEEHRRNTANLAEHLPPRQHAGGQLHMHRSTSKTSIITSQLANIQLSQPSDSRQASEQQQQQPQPQPQHRSTSFIELKHSSSASSKQRQQPQQPLVTHAHESMASSSSHWADNQMTPTTCSNLTADQTTASGGANLVTRADSSSGPDRQPRDTETNSRIQNWLLQSSDNLSISSGSKSSTSDATLPSSRSDNTTAGRYLAYSSGQLPKNDELMMMGAVTPANYHQQQQQQQQQSSVSTLVGQHRLPPAPSRSPSSHQADMRQGVRSRSPRGAQPISMIVRSTSRQSISELDEPGRLERHKVYETTETISSSGTAPHDNDDPKGQPVVRRAHQTSTSSSAQITSRKVFAYPDAVSAATVQQQEQRSQIVETRSMTTSSRQVFSQRTMSPVFGTEQQQESLWAPAAAGGRLFDDFNDFDSLIGSGAELDSYSSSSLLEQLRSRGYRSMVNQRMSGPPAPAVQAVQHGQQRQYQAHPQESAAPIEQDVVVTSSSNSMMTMSSSGIGCGPGGSLEEPPVVHAHRQGQPPPPHPPPPTHHHHHQQQQQQQKPQKRK